MTFPIPPGDNTPLVEGLSADWNDVVSAFPEDRRAELGNKLKERVGGYESKLEEYAPWDQFRESNITPEHVGTAVNLFSLIENEPKKVYEAIGEHLGMSPAEAKTAVKEMKQKITDGGDDPRLQTMQEQLDTLSQIQIAERQLQTQEQQVAAADAELEEELSAMRERYGDEFNEDEVIMRMLHKEMTAEEAYAEYAQLAGNLRQRPPSPMVMGPGGSIPSRAVDVTKLGSKDTRSLVAQMMAHGNAARDS